MLPLGAEAAEPRPLAGMPAMGAGAPAGAITPPGVLSPTATGAPGVRDALSLPFRPAQYRQAPSSVLQAPLLQPPGADVLETERCCACHIASRCAHFQEQ